MHNNKILMFCVFLFHLFLQNASYSDKLWELFLGLAWSLLCYMNTLGILMGRKAISRMSMTWKGLCPLLRKMNPLVFSSIVSKYCPFVLLLNHFILTLMQTALKSKSNLFSYLDSFLEFYKKITYDRLEFYILLL